MLAWEAAGVIRDAVGTGPQEATIGLYMTPGGDLVMGPTFVGPVPAPGEAANMGPNFGASSLLNDAPGQLVGLIHNHPSDNPNPSSGDNQFDSLLRSFGESLVSGDLVQYIATTPLITTPSGSFEGDRLHAHTDAGSAAVREGDGCFV